MQLYSENENYKLYQGNMLDMLEVIEPESIDSIVTDPPYELNFMGKGWDNSGIAVMYENRERNKNYKYIGIELTEEYLPIAKARIEYVCNLQHDNQTTIFDFIESEVK